MKKSGTILILIILLGFYTQGRAQSLKNGVGIKAQLGFPSANFGAIEDAADDYKFGVTYGLQVGNQWYFYKPKSIGIGLMVNWVDVTYAHKKVTNDEGTVERATLDIAGLEFGPVFTYAIDDPMAIDVYYNLRPTVMSTGYKIDTEDAEGFGGFGMTHSFGAGFRFKLLYAGVEYVMGKVKVTQDSTDDLLWKDEKMNSDCFRILVGVKL